jgi:CubicO group peptidase (beta-lactamase class C family)
LAALAVICAPEGWGRTVELTSELDRYIRAEMELNGLPGISAALVDSGQVIYLKAHGVRDIESGNRMTAETLVDLASVSKSMTALAVIQLEEQGLIDLDAPVRTYLRDFTLRGAEDSGEITVRHLLRHRSGLNRRSDRSMPCCGMPGSCEVGAIVASLNAAQLSSPAGRSFRYANSNYVLLAAIVERVSGVRFPEYMRTRVFEPLGGNSPKPCHRRIEVRVAKVKPVNRVPPCRSFC